MLGTRVLTTPRGAAWNTTASLELECATGQLPGQCGLCAASGKPHHKPIAQVRGPKPIAPMANPTKALHWLRSNITTIQPPHIQATQMPSGQTSQLHKAIHATTHVRTYVSVGCTTPPPPPPPKRQPLFTQISHNHWQSRHVHHKQWWWWCVWGGGVQDRTKAFSPTTHPSTN